MNYFHTKTINLISLISSGVGVGVRQIDEGVPSSNHLSKHPSHAQSMVVFLWQKSVHSAGEEIIYRKCPLSSEKSGGGDVFIN
jgi:hypothetical protein